MASSDSIVKVAAVGVVGAAAGAALALAATKGPAPVEKPKKVVLDPRIAAALEAARAECGEGKWGPDDGATATAWVAYQMSDNAFIFPITPSTLLSEMCDTWSAGGVQNAFEQVTKITQLQSEAGAAGAMHGALAVGGLATTFTASQGLLLMVPNMYKIAGELTPCVMHVAARAVAGQALSIFGDQNDIQAVRSTGFAILFGSTVQQALDFALVSHIATLRSRVPFVHAFDGFRTSHEIQKIQAYPKEIFQKVVDLLAPEIDAHRSRALNPNHPHARGTAQCDDIYFQAVEAANKYYLDVPEIVAEAFLWIEKLSGRKYTLFEYVGSPRAKYVLILMGSGAGVVEEYLAKMGDKAKDCGCLNVHLYRPWSEKHFLAALPNLSGLRAVAVCNKMKDPAAHGEPLYLDVCTSLQRAKCNANVINGRYGLSSKDFTPGMVEAIYNNLRSRNPKHPFTVGLEDDVTHYSLPFDRLETVPTHTKQCIFWGFGSDGTVGANKNTIKIIAQNTPLYAQGYFKYDALKSGGVTISHLRFGPEPIKGSYLIDAGCNYLAIHKKEYIFSFFADLMLGPLADGGTLVLNCPWTDAEMETVLPAPFRKIIGEKKLKVSAIDASAVAKRTGMGKLINNIMTAVFFELSGVLPTEQALSLLKDAVKKTYKNKGDAIVNQNIKAVEAAIEALRTVEYNPAVWAGLESDPNVVYAKTRAETPPAYVTDVLDKVQTMRGHELKVSEVEADGCVPLSQTRYAKRGVAESVPVVDMDKCIQCNVCSAICPHAVIRPFLLSHAELKQAPEAFDARKATGGNTYAGLHFRIQASPNDCTGCEVCTNACPVGALSMLPRLESIDKGHGDNWDYAMSMPNRGKRFDANTLKGCGETPYAKLVTQMFGKRLIVANATGCSSIWGGTAGWVPYAKDKETGKGTAWGNSLFEDNAEYGLGQVIHVRQRRRQLRDRVEAALARAGKSLSVALRSLLEQWLEFGEDSTISERLSDEILPLLDAEQGKAKEIAELIRLKDMFTKPSMWMFGGDGWANDIGYGGIDHAIASGNNVKIVVLDTEVYSNTGGQSSKSTPMGAVAKFAQAGRDQRKKDLGAMAMAYQHVYVASVAIGANYKQCVEAFTEAEKYDGPALLMCYAPCIEHRFFKTGLSAMSLDQRDAVECGYWPLYRFNPSLARAGDNPFILDSKKVTGDVMKFLNRQNRYAQLVRSSPAVAEKLQGELQVYLKQRHASLKQKASELSQDVAALKDGLKQANSVAEPVLIAFGSDTGVTEQVAKKFAGLCAERGVQVRRTCDLDEISDMEELKAAALGATCVVMCSTCGHGDFPQNAGLFWSSLSSSTLAPKELDGIRFCVFGMGDRSYHDSFCEAAKKIEERMKQLGATRILEMGIGDDRDEDKWETGFTAWLPKFWATIKAPEPVDDGRPKTPLFEVKYHEGAASVTAPMVPPGSQLLTVTENKRLTPNEYERDIRHLALSLEGVDFPFDLGDAVALYPENLPKDVDEALKFLELDGDKVISVKCVGDVSERHRRCFDQRVTVRQVLTNMLDLFGRPSRSFVTDLARFANNADAEALRRLGSPAGTAAWTALVDECPSFFDIMKKYPSAKMPLEQLISVLPMIKPRIYSIASDARYSPKAVEFTIVINQWKSKATGAVKTGTCTKFIQHMPVGSKVPCAVVCGTFQFPKDETTPMVMVGLGTGIAPIRSFMQDKLYKKNHGIKTGPMVVFYGCRHEKEELLYKDEWKMYEKEGILTALVGAFQFDKPHYPPKQIFVSDKMAERPELISDNLLEKGGYFFMCGPAVATPSVQKALKAALVKRGQSHAPSQAEKDMWPSVCPKTDSEADMWFKDFMAAGRYSEESY
ncbi:PFOR [Symbiodinium pilosum]|uniref:PFOR protein n=1 Tax=Symbiodinium pilosum TaxID=2952 RepID=A0A812VGE1_SYMPI|nr:PFOR [Symbiodinium pilosum]